MSKNETKPVFVLICKYGTLFFPQKQCFDFILQKYKIIGFTTRCFF